jgi:hypothetical protein
MVVLIQSIERVNGHLVIITPTGRRFHTNGRLSVRHADPERLGHQSVDVPLFRRYRQQIVCETDEAEVALQKLLAPIVAQQKDFFTLPGDVRGLVSVSL